LIGPVDVQNRQLNAAFGATRYLQITIGDNPPLLPRQQILAAPESLHAVNADHATIADGINGNLNVLGAFAVGGPSSFNGLASFPFGITGPLSISGNLNISGAIVNPSLINFAPSSSQMIFLGPGFGIGVQTGIEYFRSASDFAWYRQGGHTSSGPGTGGKTVMTLDSAGLTLNGESSQTATFLNLPKGNRASHIHFGATGDWYIRSAAVNGTVNIQDNGGNIYTGGFIGIGGGASYPVHIYSKANHNFAVSVGDLGNYSGGVYQHISGATDYSVVSAGVMWAPGFQATSDRRIKTIDKATDTAADLETINKLKVTDYHYIDTDSNGGRLQKGFIAQEVQAIIPEAVSSGLGYIPNIYADATHFDYDATTKSLTVTLAKPHDLKPGDKVRLISESSGASEFVIISVPSDHEFTVANCEKNPGRLFVYGKSIPDLLNLNYDRIFSTGIGAIQELAKRVKALEENERHLAELQQKAARVDSLEREVAELKTLIRELAHTHALEAQIHRVSYK